MQRRVALALALLAAVAVGLFLGGPLLRAEAPAPSSPGRYEIANFSGIAVSILDTQTGAVWSYRISTDGPGPWRLAAPAVPQ